MPLFNASFKLRVSSNLNDNYNKNTLSKMESYYGNTPKNSIYKVGIYGARKYGV